jgi:hypothetical protein
LRISISVPSSLRVPSRVPMTRSWSAGRRREWSRTEKTAWSRCQRTAAAAGRRCRAHLGLDDHVQRGGRGLGADGGRAERAREVEEGVGLGHDGRVCAGRCLRDCEAVGSVEVVKVVGQKLLFLPCQVRLLASTDANIYFLEERLQLGAVGTNFLPNL